MPMNRRKACMWRMDIGTCSYINLSTTEESQEGLNSWEGAAKKAGGSGSGQWFQSCLAQGNEIFLIFRF